MSDHKHRGQGDTSGTAAGSQPVIFNVYAPPLTECDGSRFPPTVPVYLWLGFIQAIVFLLFSMASWLSLGFACFFPLVDPMSWPLPAVLLMGVVRVLIIPLQIGAVVAQPVGVAIWQACAFASLRRVYGPQVLGRGWESALWWFFPIANVFMPLLCLREFRHLTLRRRDSANPKAGFGRGLITLGALMAGELLLSVVSYFVKAAYETPEEEEPAVNLETFMTDHAPVTPEVITDLATSALGAALAFVTLLIVVVYFRQQRKLYAHWSDDAYWQKLDQGLTRFG